MIDDLRSLPLTQRVGQLFFIGIAGTDMDEATSDLLSEISPGGVCLFSRNIRERQQTRDLLDAIASKITDPLLSVDQEGGLVDRLRRIMPPMPAANRLRTKNEAAELAEIIADALLTFGFNMDFAPVVDVIDQERAERTNGLFSREFGRSKNDVVDLAGSFLETLQKNDIIGCLKHFPGLGAASVDSHEELPQVSISAAELLATDVFPYRELLKTGDVKVIMVAHAAFPHLNLQEMDKNGKLLPSSLSYNLITELLRRELGFDGLVITDDLEMGAIVKNYGIGEACKMAVKAGVDMLAICADPERIREGFSAVLAAVESGEITQDRLDESLSRIAKLKGQLSPPKVFAAEHLDRLSHRITDLNEHLNRN